MEKVYITGLLFKNARTLANLAAEAHESGLVESEVRMSMGAHLTAALCLESAINEIGEEKLAGWFWDRADRLDPAAKWFLVCELAKNGKNLVAGAEPLQTIQDPQEVRNRLAHPKGDQQESDITLSRGGRVEMDASPDMVL